MNTIVTHHAPDLDAVAAPWLIKRFLPNWQDATIKFVPAGETLAGQIVDADPHILHVDTGFGMLDHHQSNADTCAVKKAYEYTRKIIDPSGKWADEALARIADVVNFYDHFREATQPDATADNHIFDGVNIIEGLKHVYEDNDSKILEIGFAIMDAAYKLMQEKIWAEEIIDKEGIRFTSKWGKAIGFETLNDAVLKLSQKMGFVVVVRKDPKKGYVRIKGTPETGVDLTKAYEKFKKLDPAATWFLHASKKILLNGTTKNPDMRPTKLSLNEIIKLLEK